MTALPGPPRCDMCEEPPSRSGPVLPLGPGGSNVDMGHPDCFRAAAQDARAGAATGRVRA